MELSRSASALDAATARWQRLTAGGQSREGDRLAEFILAAVTPSISRLATRFATREISRDELTQAGRVGVFSSLGRYRRDQGTTFSTFAHTAAQGAMLRYLRDNAGGSIYEPGYVKDRRRQIERAAEHIESRGDEPTSVNLSRETGLTIAQIERSLDVDAFAARRPLRFGTDASHGEIDPERDAQCAVDWGPEADTRIALEQCMERCLTPEERAVIVQRYRNRLSQTDVGAIIGRCQMTVSRLEHSALEKMQVALADTIDASRATSTIK